MLKLKKIKKLNNKKFSLLAATIAVVTAFSLSTSTAVKTNLAIESEITKCRSVNTELQAQCWQDLISSSINIQGVEKTFDLFGSLYTAEPSFATNCHSYAHELGGLVYNVFASQAPFKVTPAASNCGYGFYHGFMEVLAAKEEDIARARDFCMEIDEQLSGKEASSCFHGIGHGTATPHDPDAWGKPQNMIDPAVSLCQKTADTHFRLEDCYIGVYSAIATFQTKNEYGLAINSNDPLTICQDQLVEAQTACYSGMVIALMHLTQNNLVEAAYYLNSIDNDEIAAQTVQFLTGPVIYADTKRVDFTQQVLDCRALSTRLQLPCLKGFVGGLVEFHSQELEGYTYALSFCQTKSMLAQENEACLNHLIMALKPHLSRDSYLEVCQKLPIPYKESCTNEASRS